MKVLLPSYANISDSDATFEITHFTKDLRFGRVDDFMNRLNAFFADFPYENVLEVEKHFQNIIYIIVKLLGFNTRIEYHTSRGRIDMVIFTDDFIYIIEFKRDENPKVALAQIRERGYADPFISDPRKIICIGVEFSTKYRVISGWEAEEYR